jgi:signal peptidase II
VTRYYPIFNLADSAIVCGGILTVLLAVRGYHLDGTRSEVARRAATPSAATPSEDAPSADAEP